MDNNRLEELGLLKVCRTCLTVEGDMKNVFDDNNTEETLQRKLEEISSITFTQSDELPVMICLTCELRLNDAYNFKTQCQKSYETLKKYIENTFVNNLKDVAFEEKNILEETYDIKEECTTIFEDDDVRDSDEGDVDDNDDDDNDDKPLSKRKGENKRKVTGQYDIEMVNEAIVASKQKFNERKECRLCGFLSSNARGLSLHIAHVHKELKDRWCTVCYQEVDDLLEHSKTHGKRKKYVCTFCGKGFTAHGHLTEHIRSHSNYRPFKCKHCNKGFLSKRHLKVHERIHTGEKPYVCQHCFRCFTQKGSLQGHMRRHPGHKSFECEVCNQKCTANSLYHKKSEDDNSREDSNVPIEEVMIEEVKQESDFKQENDEAVIINFDKVIRIEAKNVENPESNFGDEKNKTLCTVCGKTFTTVGKLRLHMRVHTGETPYKCTYCEKRFSTRGQMVVHIRIHTGEKPHVCHVCGKGFAQTSVLNTHMKLHTGRPEVCHVCQQRFCRPAELKLHMRKHTGEKPYLCTVCGQAFIQRSHLMEHVKIHSDERPYKCTLCDKGFKQSSSLKSHIQIHTGQKPYQCSQCPYACRQSYALTQHMKQHQGDLPRPDKPHECLVCHRSFTTRAMLNSHTRTIHNTIF